MIYFIVLGAIALCFLIAGSGPDDPRHADDPNFLDDISNKANFKHKSNSNPKHPSDSDYWD